MLKIIDGKCKMPADDKQAIAVIYNLIKEQPGEKLGSEAHALIASARKAGDDETLVAAVYERRLFAETMITRPVMKAFKAMLRSQGII